MKRIVFFLCCASIMSNSLASSENDEWTNQEAVLFYEKTAAAMLDRIENWQGRPFAEISESYITLAALRSKQIKGLAIENLSFGPSGVYKTNDLPVDPVMPFRTYLRFGVGKDSFLLTKCPSFFALENCGLSFPETVALLVDHKANSGFVANSIVATLATFSGGKYAKHIIETDGRIPIVFYEKCKDVVIDYEPMDYIDPERSGMLSEDAKMFRGIENAVAARFNSICSKFQ